MVVKQQSAAGVADGLWLNRNFLVFEAKAA
jgi:hypothetical protein